MPPVRDRWATGLFPALGCPAKDRRLGVGGLCPLFKHWYEDSAFNSSRAGGHGKALPLGGGTMRQNPDVQNGPGRQQGATCGTGTVPAGRLTDPLPTEVA